MQPKNFLQVYDNDVTLYVMMWHRKRKTIVILNENWSNKMVKRKINYVMVQVEEHNKLDIKCGIE